MAKLATVNGGVNDVGITAKQRGRPKVTSDDVQRCAIVNAARRLFVQRGYGFSKTEDIAAQCGISKQTLYRFFPSKSALFVAVVESHRQKWLDLPRADDDLPLNKALMQIFKVDISEEADRDRIDVIRLVMADARRTPELAAILARHGAAFSRAALADWLERQQQRGRIRPSDSFWLAQALMDMIFGAIVTEHLGEVTWPSGDDRRHHIRRCIEVFLNGVALESAKS